MNTKGSTIFENFYTYDLLNIDIISPLEIKKVNGKKYSVIVLTENISLKYEYIYVSREISYISVLNFEEAFLNKEDKKFIGTIIDE